MWLKLRLYLVMTLLFAIIYGLLVVIASMFNMGGTLYVYAILASVIMFIHYIIGPKMVEWSMGLKYVSESQNPALHRMVGELARDAKIPKPRIGIAAMVIYFISNMLKHIQRLSSLKEGGAR